ncbi:hypothetical protein CEXT_560381 [Caerostris extrusa]|uniref:Uncharacterized protein n=1 Tax=Caerostris extrusa TaxID=172846 RepID=A0AAV4MKB4_CAEEX|nr:hypothetical protein CEXT_560381 [Caerostris extrusa]
MIFRIFIKCRKKEQRLSAAVHHSETTGALCQRQRLSDNDLPVRGWKSSRPLIASAAPTNWNWDQTAAKRSLETSFVVFSEKSMIDCCF